MSEYPHIESTPGVVGGRPRIAGRRISVADVAVWHEQLRITADEISSDHNLSLAEIHAALAYYFDHREAIDASIEETEAFVADLKATSRSRLAEKLGLRGEAA